MDVYFWDSNAVAKIYHEELGTAIATRLFDDFHTLHASARLSTLEVVSVFIKKLQEAPYEDNRPARF